MGALSLAHRRTGARENSPQYCGGSPAHRRAPRVPSDDSAVIDRGHPVGDDRPVELLGQGWSIFRGIETAADAYTARIQRRLPAEVKERLEAEGRLTGDPIMELPAGVELLSLDDLLRAADYVCVCCALTDQTHHLIDAGRLALMKPMAYLINVARGRLGTVRRGVREVCERSLQPFRVQ